MVSRELIATVLVENTPAEGLGSEHGLSMHLRYGGLNILLDFGQSDLFAQNAEVLGCDLSRVEFAVLSHAHYDHADGMPAFFARNERARLYLGEACQENCWSTKGGTAEAHYIGIGEGLLRRYNDRLARVPTAGVSTIASGVHLVPHSTPSLAEQGLHAGMLLRKGDQWQGDGFAHEMSLVFELDETARTLAVFSSCSHAGLPTIAREVSEAFPSWRISAYVGGLHLVHASEMEIAQVAEAVRDFGIDQLLIGHCTGTHATQLLASLLPGRVTSLYPGLVFSLAGNVGRVGQGTG